MGGFLSSSRDFLAYPIIKLTRIQVMNNSEKLHSVFAQSLNIGADKVTDELTYNTIPEWDSVAHMALVAEIENAFEIMMDTDDIVDMSSVGKAKEILAKYNVTF